MDNIWKSDLDRWLSPFLNALRHKARARMCPVYVAGLIGAGDRKSVQPMAAREGEVGYDQLHHFIASGVWDAAPLENVLLAEADRMVGGADAWLIVDDTALPKKGEHSVGVAPQYASSLGKTANCQSLVSLTLDSSDKAADRNRGDRPRHRLGRAFRLCPCRFWVRLQRAVSSGTERARPVVGGRVVATPECLSR